MSFLEVVFATALFGIVAASILGVFSFTMNAMAREQRQLACAEVAHRLIMAYMDDKTDMPDPNKTIEYGPGESPLKFRWEYREDPITLVEPKQDRRLKIRESPIRQDRFRQITVRAWLSEESGGTRHAEDSTPQVTMTRMFDPLFMRNPDSFINMVTRPISQAKFLEDLQGKGKLEGNAPTPRRSERFGGTSRSGGMRPRDAFQRGRSRRRMKAGRGRGRAPTQPEDRLSRWHGFTLIETLLAASMGAVLVLMVTAMFTFINKAEAAQSRRLEQVEGLARLQKVMTRAFSSLVVADPTAGAGFREKVAAGESPDSKEEVPARVLLEDDASPGLKSALRRERLNGGGVQRLEVVLDRPPVPRGIARGMSGSLSTSVQANQEDDGYIAPSTSRGVFELRPDSATLRVAGTEPEDRDGPLGWTLWWRPLVDEASLDLDPTEDADAVPIMSGLASCRWRAFIKRERKEAIRVVTNMDLPAHMEMEVRTLGGQYANWMFEVQWSVGGDGTEEEDVKPAQPEGGRFKATEATPAAPASSTRGTTRGAGGRR